MALSRCQHCQIPLTAEEAALPACPVCGGVLQIAAGPAPAPVHAPPVGGMETNSTGIWIGGGILALALGGLLLANLLSDPDGKKPDVKPAPVVAKKSEPAKKEVVPGKETTKQDLPSTTETLPAPSPWVEPPPVVVVQEPELLPLPMIAREEPLQKQPEPHRPDLQRPPLDLKKLARPFPLGNINKGMPLPLPLPLQPFERLTNALQGIMPPIDRPEGTYMVKGLGRDEKLILKGRVKTLVIGKVTGQAVLDASQFSAQEIMILDMIGGSATVKLLAPEGKVEFRAAVEGAAQVDVIAPGGQVLFSQPPQGANLGSKIDGSAQVRIAAKEVILRAPLVGDARLEVLLSKGGRLQYHLVDGSAKLHYRTADARDPEPVLVHGQRFGRTEVKRLD